ncbi:MAG: DNA-3-methyladenine glycosylase 2 family protein [SAR202 cluster bacterium]|nr:DNA-3-methyladenine glycosylase 2 family protein [SAR202 cluster bacterium]MQG31930.1 DNA-3-methyladenine glycosylase 2 family protein [SAR202 cluster bacterium]MQG45570.1 DNA-3-methyladenine glycosylase 2 family protein [SAR202 cluster bacterium]
MDRLTVSIKPVPPFNFELTAGYHTYFQSRYGTDTMEDGVYRRLIDLDDKLVLASVRSIGTLEAPELALELQGPELSPDDVESATDRVSWLLGVDQGLAPFYELGRADQAMAGLVEQFYGLHLPHTASVFEALVLAVLGQQISTNVARIIRTLLIETFGPSAEFDGETYYAFPRPASIWASSPAELHTMKLTQRKSEYVHGLAGSALDPEMGLECLEELTDREIVEKLVALRGVGMWTAQWALIRAVGRPDALPLGDLALRRVVSRLFMDGEDVNDAKVEEIAQRWSPYRTYATVYLFSALRIGAG